jgi:hypothetical protein
LNTPGLLSHGETMTGFGYIAAVLERIAELGLVAVNVIDRVPPPPARACCPAAPTAAWQLPRT